jgi:ubiquinone/menaquinone biosynthesis C-methylase UbiE
LPTERDTYASHANEYEALISREDYRGNILKAIQKVTRLDGLDVLDLGSGTGRLACLLAPHVRQVLAFDVSVHMLGIARGKLRHFQRENWLLAAAEHHRLPVKPRSADLIVSGWSLSYLAVWNPERWRLLTEAWLSEAGRVLRPKGRIILFESLGTGNELPRRLPHLDNFYGWLDEQGFESDWIRTDYRFESSGVADELVSFFFGEEMKSKIQRKLMTTLPECTGVWWTRM